jgi:hypothetical protein
VSRGIAGDRHVVGELQEIAGAWGIAGPGNRGEPRDSRDSRGAAGVAGLGGAGLQPGAVAMLRPPLWPGRQPPDIQF